MNIQLLCLSFACLFLLFILCNVYILSFYFLSGRTLLDSCPYFTLAAHHWYPTQINGHTFTGRNLDTFTIPESLLTVPAPPLTSLALSACRRVQFTEYSTEHWFIKNTKVSALNDKVLILFSNIYI